MSVQILSASYEELFGVKVPNRYKNDEKWIEGKILDKIAEQKAELEEVKEDEPKEAVAPVTRPLTPKKAAPAIAPHEAVYSFNHGGRVAQYTKVNPKEEIRPTSPQLPGSYKFIGWL